MVFVLMIGFIALLGLLVATAMSGRVKEQNVEVVLSGVPDDVLNDIRLALAGVRSHSTIRDSQANLMVSRSYYQGWVVPVSIRFFPVGVVSLVAKRVETSAIIANVEGPRNRLRLSGRFDPRAIARINNMIQARPQLTSTSVVARAAWRSSSSRRWSQDRE